jgi:hypothetical protein
MFFHVLFLFPETSQKPLEEVEEIFDDTTPSSFKYIGTPAWKTHVDTRTRRLERGEMDSEEKFDRHASQEEHHRDAVPARAEDSSRRSRIRKFLLLIK